MLCVSSAMADQIDLPGLDNFIIVLQPGAGECNAEEMEGVGNEGPAIDAPNAGEERGEARPQVDIPDALDVVAFGGRPTKFARRSNELMAFARQVRSTSLAQDKASALEEELVQTKTALTAITTLLPGAALLVGRQKVAHIGRKKTISPAEFVLLCRAAHLSSASTLRLGIRHKRVICAAADVLLRRQALGLDRMLAWCHEHHQRRRGHELSSAEMMHLNYIHLWDETKVRHDSRGNQPKGQRRSRMGVHGHSMVQRGGVTLSVTGNDGTSGSRYSEPWLCLPTQVENVSVECLLPGILQAIPQAFSFQDMEKLLQAPDGKWTLTFLPLCDKASGNLVILRAWARALETQAKKGELPRILYWPDTCGIHLAVRGKLVLHELRFHTMRHFSISNLFRLQHVRSRMLYTMEALIAKEVRREVGPPPEGLVGLAEFVDVLFDMQADHHQRGKGGELRSQKWHALKRVCVPWSMATCGRGSGHIGVGTRQPRKRVARRRPLASRGRSRLALTLSCQKQTRSQQSRGGHTCCQTCVRLC